MEGMNEADAAKSPDEGAHRERVERLTMARMLREDNPLYEDKMRTRVHSKKRWLKLRTQ